MGRLFRSLGDCSATKFAPTAQVAAQQGTYLARLFNTMAQTNALEAEIKTLRNKPGNHDAAIIEKQKELSKVKLMKPFEYSHQGCHPSPSLPPGQRYLLFGREADLGLG